MSARASPAMKPAASLSKSFHVQDQVIDQLRADHLVLREALDIERTGLRECRIAHDKELKELQRENLVNSRLVKQQQLKIEELGRELATTKETLLTDQHSLKALEKEHVFTVKELKLKNARELEKAGKTEIQIDNLRSEVDSLKENLERERNATTVLIREHAAEVKMLREQVKYNSTEAFRELKDRATKERDEYREMQEEAEKTYKVLEQDFRSALAEKDEQFKTFKAESKLAQKELEDQLKACLKEHSSLSSSATPGGHENEGTEKIRRLKNEVSVLKEQNRKLLSELQSAEKDKTKNADAKKEIERLQNNLNNSEKQSRSTVAKMVANSNALCLKSECRPIYSRNEANYDDLKKALLVLRSLLQ